MIQSAILLSIVNFEKCPCFVQKQILKRNRHLRKVAETVAKRNNNVDPVLKMRANVIDTKTLKVKLRYLSLRTENLYHFVRVRWICFRNGGLFWNFTLKGTVGDFYTRISHFSVLHAYAICTWPFHTCANLTKAVRVWLGTVFLLTYLATTTQEYYKNYGLQLYAY